MSISHPIGQFINLLCFTYNGSDKPSTGKQVHSIIEKVASKNAQIHTDEFRSYRILTRNSYTHSVVNYSAGEYAKNGIHMNQVENFRLL